MLGHEDGDHIYWKYWPLRSHCKYKTLHQVHFWCFTSQCSSIAIYWRFVERFLPIVKKKRSYSILLKGAIGAVLSQAALTLNLFIKATWRGQTQLTRTEFYRIIWINSPPNFQHLGSDLVGNKMSRNHPLIKPVADGEIGSAGFASTKKPSCSIHLYELALT